MFFFIASFVKTLYVFFLQKNEGGEKHNEKDRFVFADIADGCVFCCLWIAGFRGRNSSGRRGLHFWSGYDEPERAYLD
jgi:hypothetical protein